MKKNFYLYCGLVTIFLSQNLSAAGYKIPELSSDSMALAGSNIAKSFGSDASYYNPANISFLENKHFIEGNAMFVYLGKTKFTNYSKQPGTKDSTSENFFSLAPTIYYISPEIFDNFRLGFSSNVPVGLSIKWNEPYPASTSKKFDLKVFELSSNIAYKISENFSIAAGIRGVYTTGNVVSEVKLSPEIMKMINPSQNASQTSQGYHMERDLKGNSIDVGYNLAATYKPLSNLSLSATYRSKIDLTVTGNAQIKENGTSKDYKASVTIPLPASLNLGLAYELHDFTFLFDYERTYWSSLKSLDFNYKENFSHPLTINFADKPVPKNAKNSNTYRFGLAWQYSQKLRLMAGFGIDEKMLDKDKIGFEMPDAKAYIYSFGANYAIDENMNIGFGYLYQDKKDRVVNKQAKLYPGTVDGKFKNTDAQLTSISFSYKF
ncbi:porin [Campylobacter sp. FMV-PI01]|uniref:Porin n=1 Tax=Campylobacter portucalensis TaxID=2608384 RepID=A0A6L5WI01_9BACT|nr:porin [Campylobacter portucalensis]MSN96536.1 porin [Campylobacter portucalensis]